MLGPQRHDDHPGGPGQPDGEHPQPHREQHAPVLGHDPRDGHPLALGRQTLVVRPQVGGAPGQGRGQQPGDHRDGERGLRPPPCDDGSPDERPDEQADPGHAAQGRHRPGAQGDRGGGGEVALPGQEEHGAGRPHEEHGDAQHPQRGGDEGERTGHGIQPTGGHERPALADPLDEHPGRDGGGELGQRRDADEQGRQADRGAQAAGAEGHHRQHGARPDRPDRRGPEGGHGDPPQRELLLLPHTHLLNLSRPMREPSPGHRNGSGARVKVPVRRRAPDHLS